MLGVGEREQNAESMCQELSYSIFSNFYGFFSIPYVLLNVFAENVEHGLEDPALLIRQLGLGGLDYQVDAGDLPYADGVAVEELRDALGA